MKKNTNLGQRTEKAPDQDKEKRKNLREFLKLYDVNQFGAACIRELHNSHSLTFLHCGGLSQ